jgi:hypothetical protein
VLDCCCWRLLNTSGWVYVHIVIHNEMGELWFLKESTWHHFWNGFNVCSDCWPVLKSLHVDSSICIRCSPHYICTLSLQISIGCSRKRLAQLCNWAPKKHLPVCLLIFLQEERLPLPVLQFFSALRNRRSRKYSILWGRGERTNSSSQSHDSLPHTWLRMFKLPCHSTSTAYTLIWLI